MATDKRERQKALRAQKLEEMKKVQKRRQTGKQTIIVLVVVALLAGSAVLLFKSNPPRTAVIPTTLAPTTSAPCPKPTTATGNTAAVPGFPAIANPLPAGTWGHAPVVTVPTSTPPTVEQATNLIVGKGAAVELGCGFTAQYVLADYASHKVLQSSWTAQPFSATLTYGGLINGWVKGMIGMRAGGRRELIIPPSLGYGSGYGSIPANDTLVFVIDLLKVN